MIKTGVFVLIAMFSTLYSQSHSYNDDVNELEHTCNNGNMMSCYSLGYIYGKGGCC